MMIERVGDGYEEMEGYCSTGQSPQRAVVPMEEEEEMSDECGKVIMDDESQTIRVLKLRAGVLRKTLSDCKYVNATCKKKYPSKIM
jgi:hypothetical protein